MSAYDLTERDADALNACDRAAALLRSMGFELVRTAMSTESCYYKLPDHPGTIRVSAHRYGRTEMRATGFPVLALVTFGTNQGPVGDVDVEGRVTKALGYYLWRRLCPERTRP